MNYEYLKANTIPVYGYTILGNPIPATPRAPIVAYFSIAEVKGIIRHLTNLYHEAELVLGTTCYIVPVDQRPWIDPKVRDGLGDKWVTLEYQIKIYRACLEDMFKTEA